MEKVHAGFVKGTSDNRHSYLEDELLMIKLNTYLLWDNPYMENVCFHRMSAERPDAFLGKVKTALFFAD